MFGACLLVLEFTSPSEGEHLGRDDHKATPAQGDREVLMVAPRLAAIDAIRVDADDVIDAVPVTVNRNDRRCRYVDAIRDQYPGRNDDARRAFEGYELTAIAGMFGRGGHLNVQLRPAGREASQSHADLLTQPSSPRLPCVRLSCRWNGVSSWTVLIDAMV